MGDSKYLVDPQDVREKMPVGLGRILKVPASAWENWGIEYNSEDEFRELVKEDREGYKDEWELTTDQGQADIANAAVEVGLGDVNANLNSANASVVSRIVERSEDEVNILDFGAGSGNTTIAIYEELDEEGKEKVNFTLLEPSKDQIYGTEDQVGAVQKLNERGLVPGDYEIVIGTGMEKMPDMVSGIYQIVTANASAHHHGYMGGEEIENYGVKGPLHHIFRILDSDGFYVDSDWRNSMWEHPWRVREFLKELGMYGEMIDNELNLPDQANSPAPEEDPMLQEANREIRAFWKKYDEVRSTEEPQFLLLEGHRPTHRIWEQLENVGFDLDSEEVNSVVSQNPFYLSHTSGLNSMIVGQKKVEE